MSEHVSRTPLISEMDPEVHLRNMEEELIQNQLRTDEIEANLQAILNKLDTSQHGMQDGLSFGIAELEKMLESNKIGRAHV